MIERAAGDPNWPARRREASGVRPPPGKSESKPSIAEWSSLALDTPRDWAGDGREGVRCPRPSLVDFVADGGC